VIEFSDMYREHGTAGDDHFWPARFGLVAVGLMRSSCRMALERYMVPDFREINRPGVELFTILCSESISKLDQLRSNSNGLVP
jgi:hypothetical protein